MIEILRAHHVFGVISHPILELRKRYAIFGKEYQLQGIRFAVHVQKERLQNCFPVFAPQST